MSDFEDKDTTLPVVSVPSSLDRVPTSSGYSPDSDSDFEPTEDDSSDEDLMETAEVEAAEQRAEALEASLRVAQMDSADLQ
nr:hypothetical protein [Tanacetum cinerariifolium]